MPVVRVIIDGAQACVRSPFEAKDVIKSMPVRRWHATRKVWIIPAADVQELTEALEAAGFTVIVIRRAGQQQHGHQHQEQQDKQSPPRDGHHAGGASWADAMFLALGPELAVKAYKALSRALHPDVGGSTEQMQILNAARDRHGDRR